MEFCPGACRFVARNECAAGTKPEARKPKHRTSNPPPFRHDRLRITRALRTGRLEVVDADLSKYFDTIPHARMLKLMARRIGEVLAGGNRLLRVGAGCFHFGNRSRVMGQLDILVRDRERPWLWRKHGRRKALWSDDPDERLWAHYGLWPLPLRVAWRRATQGRTECLARTRPANPFVRFDEGRVGAAGRGPLRSSAPTLPSAYSACLVHR